MTDEQVFKLIEGMNDEDAIGIMWGACIDWYLGDKQGACVSIKNLPKLIGLIVEWKNHKLAQALATARAEGAAEEKKRIAKEYGDYRYYVDQKKLFGRHKIGRTLRFFLLPHTEHKKGDDKDIT